MDVPFTKDHSFLYQCCGRSSLLSKKSENEQNYLLSDLKIERTNKTNLKMDELHLNKKKSSKHRNIFLQSYPGGGAKWIPAWELHSRDPTLVMWKACYSNLAGGNFYFFVLFLKNRYVLWKKISDLF